MRANRGKTSILLVFVVAIGAAAAGTGCVLHARAYPTTAPPAPQYVEVDYRPGYVWIEGRWTWRYGSWQWEPGYWVAERPGYYYTQGYWSTRGGSHVWVGGTWKRGNRGPAGVYRRDHRRSNNGPKGVWTRDHRRSNANRPPPRNNRGVGGVWQRDQRKPKKEKKKNDNGRVRTRDHRR